MSKPPDPPPQAAALFKKYLAEPALTADQLSEQLRTYLEFVARVSQVNPQLNLALANRLAQGLEHLLALAPAEKFKFVQAAARYFIEDEDADLDLISDDGFDDDVMIFNQVAHHLGHDELQIL